MSEFGDHQPLTHELQGDKPTHPIKTLPKRVVSYVKTGLHKLFRSRITDASSDQPDKTAVSQGKTRREILTKLGLAGGGILLLGSGAACDIIKPHEPVDVDTNFDKSSNIDIGMFPEKCPPEVLKASGAALDVGFHITKNGKKYLFSLSGVVLHTDDPELKNRLALTAGHGVREQGKVMDVSYGAAIGLSPDGYEVRTQVVRTASADEQWNVEATSPDLCFMQTSPDLSKLRSVTIREEPITLGEPLFFIDYGPDGDDPAHKRYPSAPDPQYRKPAIYGGPAVGAVVNGDDGMNSGKLHVMTFRNLGGRNRDAEEQVRPGSSGGAVVDAKGQLVGIIHAMSLDKWTGREVEEGFNVNLRGMTSKEAKEHHTLAIIKSVTPADQVKFELRLKQQPTSGSKRWG